MKKPRLSGSFNVNATGADSLSTTDLFGEMTFGNSMGSLGPSISYSGQRMEMPGPDGIVVNGSGQRVGVSINGQVYLDDAGNDSLRASISRERYATGPFEDYATGYGIGADIGRFSGDLMKDMNGTTGSASYQFNDGSSLSAYGSDTGEYGINYTKNFADGGEVPERKTFATYQPSPRVDIFAESPEVFAGYLDEMGLPPEERARMEQMYYEKHRTVPLTPREEGRRVGEILPMSWPEGMTGSEALMSGKWEWDVPEAIRSLYDAPAEGANVLGAAAAGVPVSKSKGEEAMTALAPVIMLGEVGGLSAERAIDRAQRRQSDAFFARHQPEYDPQDFVGGRYYHPTAAERAAFEADPMNAPLGQHVYDQNSTTARLMLEAGADPQDVFKAAGHMIPVPLRTALGKDYGYRLVQRVPPELIDEFRPGASAGLPVVRKDMKKYISGEFLVDDPAVGGPAIHVNQRLPKETQERTIAHEQAHGDLNEGSIGLDELGANGALMREDRFNQLAAIDQLMKETKDPAVLSALRRHRDNLRNMTPFEMYHRNPGEMLARLAEGDTSMAVRLTPIEALNPYIRPGTSFAGRVGDATATAILSDTYPLYGALEQVLGVPLAGADVHALVPMDLNKAIISTPDFVPTLTENVVEPVKKYAEGGVVAGAPNRAQAFKENFTPAPEENPYNILNLDPGAFQGALDELGLPPEERKRLEEAYFAKNSPIPMSPREPGRRVGEVLPASWPQGMSGAEALMSGNWEFDAPEFVRGVQDVPAEAVNVVNASVNGFPVDKERANAAMTGLASLITLPAPLRGPMRPNVVSMSGAGERPRGLGDNGGPALDDTPVAPTRTLDPRTGLYSPSYEAAKNLPQDVGTPQQMRAMLLNNGAKEEELVYSGVDRWLKEQPGNVTKQQLQDVLRVATMGDGSTGPMYAPQRLQASGALGNVNNIGYLRDRAAQDLYNNAINERNNRMDSYVRERGYAPVDLSDYNTFRSMSDRVMDMYSRSRGGAEVDGVPLPPASLERSIRVINRLLNWGASFDSPEVQQHIEAIRNNPEYVARPGEIPRYTDEVLGDPDSPVRRYPYRDSLPGDEYMAVMDRLDSMSDADIFEYFGMQPEDIKDAFVPGDTAYGSYAPSGLKDYFEDIYRFNDTGRGVVSEALSEGRGLFRNPHFADTPGGTADVMFHVRGGHLNTPEGPALHIAEVQSDIGQSLHKSPDSFYVPGVTPPVFQLDKKQRAMLSTYLNHAKTYKDLEIRADEGLSNLYENYFTDAGEWDKSKPGYQESVESLKALRDEKTRAEQTLLDYEEENHDFFQTLQEEFGTPRNMTFVNAFGGTFDPSTFESILAGREKPKKGYGNTSKQVALPFATSTNRWVDAALKNMLIKAAKEDVEWLTLPKGEDVAQYTYGDVDGQTEFYEKIVPNRLKGLYKKYLPGEPEFKTFTANGFNADATKQEVLGLRMTPEIKKYILENGLPSFRKGGVVDGSSLDLDIFAQG